VCTATREKEPSWEVRGIHKSNLFTKRPTDKLDPFRSHGVRTIRMHQKMWDAVDLFLIEPQRDVVAMGVHRLYFNSQAKIQRLSPFFC